MSEVFKAGYHQPSINPQTTINEGVTITPSTGYIYPVRGEGKSEGNQRFQLTIESIPNSYPHDPIARLKLILKRMKRGYGFRCLSCSPVAPVPEPAPKAVEQPQRHHASMPELFQRLKAVVDDPWQGDDITQEKGTHERA
jgi:hypothetical protein